VERYFTTVLVAFLAMVASVHLSDGLRGGRMASPHAFLTLCQCDIPRTGLAPVTHLVVAVSRKSGDICTIIYNFEWCYIRCHGG
jgi:hypothetical protein